MTLVIVNPRNHAAQQPGRKGKPMATRKRRSPAQRRAFARMISRNPYHRRRRRRNPSALSPVMFNPRRVTHRRRVRRNPVRHYAYRRRHRNPGSFLSTLMSTEGLMGVAAVVATPTLMEYASTNLFPSVTGMYDALAQTGVGLALSWVVYKFLDKQVGQVVGLVAVGTGVAQAISVYTNPTGATVSGMGARRRLGAARLGTRTNAQGYITMSGYVPSSGNNNGNMNGYATMKAAMRPAAPREPGVYYF